MGLDVLHSKGIIHRDVKPENIMLNAVNQPILSDFGCCKLISKKQEAIQSDPDFVGTPQFMAPELITIPKYILTQSAEQIMNSNENEEEEEETKENEKDCKECRNEKD